MHYVQHPATCVNSKSNMELSYRVKTSPAPVQCQGCVRACRRSDQGLLSSALTWLGWTQRPLQLRPVAAEQHMQRLLLLLY